MPRFVLDASLTCAWLFSDQVSEPHERLLDRLHEGWRALVPSIWSFEVANVLWKSRRAGALDRQRSEELYHLLRVLPIEIERESLPWVFDRVSALADRENLSVYDAAYLELARRESIPLATLDQRLAEAAQRVGVDCL